MCFSIYILVYMLPKPHTGVTALHTAGEEATRHCPQPVPLSDRPIAWLHPSFRPHSSCSGRPRGQGGTGARLPSPLCSQHSPRGKVIWSHMPSSCPKYTFFSEGWIPSSIILQARPRR